MNGVGTRETPLTVTPCALREKNQATPSAVCKKTRRQTRGRLTTRKCNAFDTRYTKTRNCPHTAAHFSAIHGRRKLVRMDYRALRARPGALERQNWNPEAAKHGGNGRKTGASRPTVRPFLYEKRHLLPGERRNASRCDSGGGGRCCTTSLQPETAGSAKRVGPAQAAAASSGAPGFK